MGQGGRAPGDLPAKPCPVLQEPQVSVPWLTSSISSLSCGFPYITSSDVQHLFVPAVKPLLAPHQIFSHLSASASTD